MNTWVNLHNPKNLDDWSPWSEFKKKILLWQNNQSLEPIIIRGDSASGKTILSEAILNFYDIDNRFVIHAIDIKSDKMNYEKIRDVLRGNAVYQKIYNYGNKRFSDGIVIEDIDELEAKDFTFLINFLKDVWKKKITQPLIITINSSNDNDIIKRLKTGLLLDIQPIGIKEIQMAYRRLKSELNLGITDDIIQYLSHNTQKDWRQAILLFETMWQIGYDRYIKNNNINIDKLNQTEYKNINKFVKISFSDAEEALHIINETNKDISMSQLLKNILLPSSNKEKNNDKNKDVNTFAHIFNISESEVIYLPQVIHENISSVLDKNYNGTNDEKIDILLKYYDGLIDSQVFYENSFGANSNWNITEYINICGSVFPWVLLSSLNVKEKIPFKIQTTSSTLSHYGHRGITLKNMNEVLVRSNMCINQAIMVSHVLWNAILNGVNCYEKVLNDFNNTTELSVKNGINDTHIEKILKLFIFIQKKLINKKNIDWSFYSREFQNITSKVYFHIDDIIQVKNDIKK
jgi:hypothetical protein